MVGTVGIASAAPTNNFSITTLTTDNDYAEDGETDDNGPISITSTHVLWNSEDGVEAYAIADLSNPTVTDVDEDDGEHMFTNIKTATAHYLIGTEVDSTAVITGIGSIDDDGTSSSAAVIDLSEDIVISTASNGADIDLCNLLGSGYGHLVIWDYCVGKMWNIDLPSGTVTVTEGVNTSADLQGVPTNDYNEGTQWFNQFGVVEHVDGEYSMVVGREDEGNDPVAIARFAITDPAGTVEDILPLTGAPDFWNFAVNVEAELWCTHIEGGSDDLDSSDGLEEPTICADATFSVADYLPSTGANSMFLVVSGLLLVAGGALALVRRPRIA
jgi:LPXTG-motif cell wall-anchored protein